MGLYEDLKTERVFDIQIERKGKPVSLRVELK